MSTPFLLPEWAAVRAVILAWPYPHGDWKNNFQQAQDCYWQLLYGLNHSMVDVWLLLHPSINIAQWRDECPESNLDWSRVKVYNTIAYDDTWVRDYGPLSLSNKYISFTFNGWGGKYPAAQDDAVAEQVLKEQKLNVNTLQFVCEGGGLETNGATLMLNKDCIVTDTRNRGVTQTDVEELLKNTLGASAIEWLEGIQLTGDDTDGHIDTIARFANANTVIYTGRNNKHPDAQALEKLHEQITTIANKQKWATYELPTPVYRSLLDDRVLPATYANFLIANDTVLIPTYGVDEDSVALNVFTQAFPSYRLLPIRCDALLEQHGSLHCATMQVAWPQNMPSPR